MSTASLFEVRARLDELVQRSALYLDQGRFGEAGSGYKLLIDPITETALSA